MSTVSPPAQSQAQPVAATDRRFQRAAAALRENRPEAAEALVQQFLGDYPDDPSGLKLLADALGRLERHAEAEEVLGHCLAIAPNFHTAAHSYVHALLWQNKMEQAFAKIGELLAAEPENNSHRNLKAVAHMWAGDYAQAASEYEKILKSSPKIAAPWMAYAVSLRTLGRYEESVAAYREVIARFPNFGEAYWSLANLKTFRFAEAEIETMRALLERSDLNVDSRVQLHFALGKALEDSGEYLQAFHNYREANAIWRAQMNYNSEETSNFVTMSTNLFDKEFFAAHANYGIERADPIFIIGMPRSGSTLVEQILSSHSTIEGTMELRILPYMVRKQLGNRTEVAIGGSWIPYPECLRNIGADEIRSLAEEYLERAQVHRRQPRPFFIDKLPENCGHVGLIHLMFPNAKIIDVRRHPLACCFSCFKQHFPVGQHYSYSLPDLGRYYVDYVRHMAHYDEVLPGRIHRVFYERLVDDPEHEIRAMLDYLGLPFEAECLRFYETKRLVRTASSEQVRMPIYKEGLDQWKNFEQGLGPLKATLGAVLEAYPNVPTFEKKRTKDVRATAQA